MGAWHARHVADPTYVGVDWPGAVWDGAAPPPGNARACDSAPVEVTKRQNRRPETEIKYFHMSMLAAPCRGAPSPQWVMMVTSKWKQLLHRTMSGPVVVAACTALAFLGSAPLAHAQKTRLCRFLCSPGLNIEPTVTLEPLFNVPRVAEGGGEPERPGRETVLETVFALDIPTSVPSVGFTFEAIVAPFRRTGANPFTGRTAGDLGGDVRDNPVQIESEINLAWLAGKHTGEWVESHFDIVDQFSPARRPNDRSVYTHKLNLELDTAVAVFKWLPDAHWLRHVELEGSLDYVATGLPRADDEVPVGGERLFDDASPWSFSLVFVIPIIVTR